MHIVPIYRTEKEELRFPKILINGKRRARYYDREQTFLSHQQYWEQVPYALLTLHAQESLQTAYRMGIPLPSSMRGKGELSIEQFLEDCCDMHLANTQPVDVERRTSPPLSMQENDNSLLPVVQPVYEANVTFIQPQEEKIKERYERITVRINYIVNRHDVLPNYADNASQLQKVDEVLRVLSNKNEYRITEASIKGYASPEAPYDHNLRLSQRRADGFKNYLIEKYGLHDLSTFSSAGLGEDWDGLRNAVEKSDMPYRREVLGMIDGIGIFNGREKSLMDLAGGNPYRYMLHTFFPPLRRMEMEIAYTVRPFDTDEAEKLLNDRPQDLSQEEIYKVAKRRNNGRTNRSGYGSEYELAVRYFPDDATANINASSAALVQGDLDAAQRYLEKVEDNPEAFNNLGIYYWLRGDIQRAETYFRKALSVKGDEEKAERNLRLLQQWKKDKGL